MRKYYQFFLALEKILLVFLVREKILRVFLVLEKILPAFLAFAKILLLLHYHLTNITTSTLSFKQNFQLYFIKTIKVKLSSIKKENKYYFQ